MNSVIFENNGVLDPRAIRTFGVSAKDKENAIGYFGTGLKYAIAILLREGVEVELLAGLERYKFTKSETKMRGKSFEIVSMNGYELPFTTQLGKNWEPWQAFRELYCNCLDENGKVYTTEEEPRPTPDKTFFIVRGKAMSDAFRDRNKIVLSLPSSIQLHSDRDIEVFDQPSRSLYYRGVRVMDFDRPALLTYNILEEMELTEDRTLKFASSALSRVPMSLSRMVDKPTIRKILTASDSYAEREFNFLSLTYFHDGASKEFMEVLAEEYRFNNDKLNKTARDVQRKIMNSSAAKHYEATDLTTVERKQFDRATTICRRVIPDFDDYKILVVKDLGQETIALADQAERTIVVSKRIFTFGTKYLVSTLIEEHAHLKTGYADHTRALQTYLFDQITTLIENYVLQEPI